MSYLWVFPPIFIYSTVFIWQVLSVGIKTDYKIQV